MTPVSSSQRVELPPTRQDGKAIRELRIRRGMYMKELAERVRCHPNHLQHIERQTRSASPVMMHRLADALGVEVSDISKRDAAA